MKTAGIIGLGLIGGSIAKTLKKRTEIKTVKAYDINASSLAKAKDDGAIDDASNSDFSLFADCDIVFICVPLPQIPQYIEKLAGTVKKGCLVTDVGSVKKSVIEKSGKYPDMQFIGGHPMAGSEKEGYTASSDFLLENAYYIIVPSANASEDAVARFVALVEKFIAIPIIMTAAEHDGATAAISHAPHMAAAAIVNAVRKLGGDGETLAALAAGGFKDITRIASSDSRLWQSIANENRTEIIKVLDDYRLELDEIIKYLKDGNETELGGYLRLAKDYRDNMPSAGRAKFIETYDLYADITDKPGSIAVVATILGMNGVNIKNIGIINNREYQGGALQIMFGSKTDLESGAELLKNSGFHIHIKK